MRFAMTILGLSIVSSLATAQSTGAKMTPVMQHAFSQMKAARAWENVNVTGYDCSINTVSANRGKCTIQVDVDGIVQRLVASPEVAAPWGNGYGSQEGRPQQGLTLLVNNSEILTVKDSKGAVVSTKFDYSR
jgi:hypothetical protein